MTARITIKTLQNLKEQGEPIACLTSYDATFTHTLEENGIEVILVGDSLGMTVQGQPSTVPVTIDQMIYHTQCVMRASKRALVMADMPFLTCISKKAAYKHAARLMQEGGCTMIKIEGGAEMVPLIKSLTQQGVPVCSHLGLLPQQVNQLSGYRYQGVSEEAAARIFADAKALREAGVSLIVVECIPAELAAQLSQQVHIPVIGIGAGNQCDGQILVLHDLLGLTQAPSFARNFLEGAPSIGGAIRNYVDAVKNRTFPNPAETKY